MLNCLIVDDDNMARIALKHLCEKMQLAIVAIFENAEQALEGLKDDALQFDLLFLDVEMPGLSGMELLDALPVSPLVVFTTSKADYAFNAFEYGAIDFLKKPIAQPRFEQAVNKALSIIKVQQEFRANANELYVKEEGRLTRISNEDILYFENVGDYVRIRTASGGSHIIHGTLKGLDEKLDDPRFLKVHRSFIVNLNKIVDIEENSLVIDRAVIPISRAHKPLLMNRLKII